MPKQPDYTSDYVADLQGDAELPETLMGGTKAMRDAGQKFLPMFANEDGASYDARRNASFLHNSFKLAIADMRGKVFRKPVRMVDIPDGAPEEEWEKDWDRQGNSLTSYARQAFESGMVSGARALVSDWPSDTAGLDPGMEKKVGARAYGTQIPLCDWRSLDWETVYGRKRIARFRWYVCETNLTDDGGEEKIEQIRMVVPGQVAAEDADEQYAAWFYWERHGEGRDRKWQGPFHGGSLAPHVDVPVDIYSPLLDMSPPMVDLAFNNQEHWQSSSDQRTILHFVRVPILFGSGMTDDERDALEAIGAGLMMTAQDPMAKLGYVEHKGEAIEAGWKDLSRLTEQAAMLAARPQIDKPRGTETATARIMDEAQIDSQLAAYAIELGEVLTRQLHRMQQWEGIEPRGRIEVNTDFGLSAQDKDDLERLEAARERGDISRQTYLERLAEARILPEGVTVEDELDRIDTEAPSKVPFEQGGAIMGEVLPFGKAAMGAADLEDE